MYIKFKRNQSYAFSIVLAFVFILSSCQKETSHPMTGMEITASYDVVTRILNSDEISNFDTELHGNLITDNLTEIYSRREEDDETKFSLYEIPIIAKSGQNIKSVYAYYDYGSEKLEFALYEIELSEDILSIINKNSDVDFSSLSKEDMIQMGLSYSATETMSNLNGEVLIKQKFQNNTQIYDDETAESRGFLGWYCMVVCIIDKMGWWDRIGCATSIATAIAAPNPLSVFGVVICGGSNWGRYNDCYNNHCFNHEPACNSMSPPTNIWGSEIQCNFMQLNWSAVSGATGYDVLYYTGGSWTHLTSIVSDTYLRINLPGAGTYKLGIKAKCGGLISSISYANISTPPYCFTGKQTHASNGNNQITVVPVKEKIDSDSKLETN